MGVRIIMPAAMAAHLCLCTEIVVECRVSLVGQGDGHAG
jgi:hypothetical protein